VDIDSRSSNPEFEMPLIDLIGQGLLDHGFSDGMMEQNWFSAGEDVLSPSVVGRTA